MWAKHCIDGGEVAMDGEEVSREEFWRRTTPLARLSLAKWLAIGKPPLHANAEEWKADMAAVWIGEGLDAARAHGLAAREAQNAIDRGDDHLLWSESAEWDWSEYGGVPPDGFRPPVG